MGTGAITQYIDVAQVVFYLFLLFFVGLVIYLTLAVSYTHLTLPTILLV